MSVAYGKDSRLIRYTCKRGRDQTAAPTCQSFGAWRLERAIESLLLEGLSAWGMEAMLAAAQLYTEDHLAERTRWQQKIERAGYEVQLARRQYDAVDPDNRLVARELERRFEKALGELERAKAEAEAEEHLTALQEPLSAREEQELMSYAPDLARLWQAPTTRPQDRKAL
jgi:hypothetical protein